MREHVQKKRPKISILCTMCMCSFLRGGGGGGRGVEEKRLVFVSKKISVFTEDPYCNFTNFRCTFMRVVHT